MESLGIVHDTHQHSKHLDRLNRRFSIFCQRHVWTRTICWALRHNCSPNNRHLRIGINRKIVTTSQLISETSLMMVSIRHLSSHCVTYHRTLGMHSIRPMWYDPFPIIRRHRLLDNNLLICELKKKLFGLNRADIGYRLLTECPNGAPNDTHPCNRLNVKGRCMFFPSNIVSIALVCFVGLKCTC